MTKIREALETRIQAMPGSDRKKQIIVDTIAYSIGAAVGLGVAAVIYAAGKESCKINH